jgi:hypothetical protein
VLTPPQVENLTGVVSLTAPIVLNFIQHGPRCGDLGAIGLGDSGIVAVAQQSLKTSDCLAQSSNAILHQSCRIKVLRGPKTSAIVTFMSLKNWKCLSNITFRLSQILRKLRLIFNRRLAAASASRGLCRRAPPYPPAPAH